MIAAEDGWTVVILDILLQGIVKLETIGQPGLWHGSCIEADLPEVLVGSVANQRSLLTLLLASIYDSTTV